jgi:large subunit ribosomal protein L18
MAKKSHERVLLERRKKRVRKSIAGTAQRPRVTVFRSLKHIYAQAVDDESGATLAAASSVALKIPGGSIEGAKAVGKAFGESAKEKGIQSVCFDRNGRLFHGRVKALADAAREAGLEF